MRIGFDHDKYTAMQSEHILKRIAKFGGKLYLEFGGKLFDDFHAARVLPGFAPDSKIRMLLQLKDQADAPTERPSLRELLESLTPEQQEAARCYLALYRLGGNL